MSIKVRTQKRDPKPTVSYVCTDKHEVKFPAKSVKADGRNLRNHHLSEINFDRMAEGYYRKYYEGLGDRER